MELIARLAQQARSAVARISTGCRPPPRRDRSVDGATVRGRLAGAGQSPVGGISTGAQGNRQTRPVEPWRFVRNFAMHLSGDHGAGSGRVRAARSAPARRGAGANPGPARGVAPGPRCGHPRPSQGWLGPAGGRSGAPFQARCIRPGGARLGGSDRRLGAAPRGWRAAAGLAPRAILGKSADVPLHPEIAPAVGTGKHLALPGVRYCHYQAARLEIIKQAARSPEDVRAFNLLVVDYNSRCSDFFYQDKDLAQVNAEVAARRAQFEADAKRIMAGWPGHAPDGSNSRWIRRRMAAKLAAALFWSGRIGPATTARFPAARLEPSREFAMTAVTRANSSSLYHTGAVMQDYRHYYGTNPTGGRRSSPKKPGPSGRDGATGCTQTAGHDR